MNTGGVNLHQMEAGAELAPFEPEFKDIANYPPIEDILQRLNDSAPTRNVPTQSLRVNGHCVQDSFDSYLGSSDHLSSSTLKEALKTPLNLYYSINHGWKDLLDKHRQKSSFDMGTFIHQCILEPTKFKRVVVEPKYSRSTKDGVKRLIWFWYRTIKEKQPERLREIIETSFNSLMNSFGKLPGKKEFLAKIIEASGIKAVNEVQHAQIVVTHRNYMRYGGGILPRILKHSKREISFYGTDIETGLNVRVRPDALAFKENIGVDAIISVKSTRFEDLEGYYRQSANLKYELSEGMYQDVISNVTGRQFLTTLCIMVQTVPPFGVALLRWDPEDLENGKYKYRMALQTAKECIESNKFPGFDAYAESGNFGIIQMKQPAWANKVLPEVQIED